MISSCVAPWNCLMIKTNGEMNPDCVFIGTYGNIKNTTIDRYWQNTQVIRENFKAKSNELSKYCKICINKEDISSTSRRTFFNEKLTFEPKNYPNIKYLDINLSNKCNLKCLMCSSKCSSSWIQDEKKLDKTIFKDRQLSEFRNFNVKDLFRNLLYNDMYFQNLQYISLKGGEPLLEEQNIEFLEYFVNKGISRNIIIDMTTNGTIYNKKMVDVLLKFRQVIISVSIEGVGDLYRYIRGGKHYSINHVETTIKRLRSDGFDLNISTLLTAFNINKINDIWFWYVNHFSNLPIYFKNVVVSPSYLRPNVIPLTERNKFLHELVIPKDLIKFSKAYQVIDSSDEDKRLFLNYVNQIHKIRGINFFDIQPSFYEYFKEYDV